MASNAPPSGPGPAPQSSPEEDWNKKHFGHLLDTSEPNLFDLGKRIRKEKLKAETTNSRLVARIASYFSLVFILELDDTKMAIRIPVYGRAGNLIPAGQWLKSHVDTLQYVKAIHTKIPVPEVYAFDRTGLNEIGAPYIAMSHIGGRPVAYLWSDDTGPTPLETRRRRILEHLAQLMTQLHVVLPRFNRIGSLLASHDGISSLGPCFGWDFADDGLMTINWSATFESSKAWVESSWAPLTQTQERKDLRDGCQKLLETVLSMLPDQNSDFGLAPCRFDWQNIMADEEGNITALEFWESAQTRPDFLGCLRFPMWIVRNGGPVNANVDLGGHDNATKRGEYRKYYLKQIQVALETQFPTRAGDYTYIANSHAAEVFWVAYTNPKFQATICQGFVEEVKKGLAGALPDGLRGTPLSILEKLGRGELQQDATAALEKGLKVIMGY